LFVALTFLLTACAGSEPAASTAPPDTTAASAATTVAPAGLVDSKGKAIPEAPDMTSGPLNEATRQVIERVWSGLPADVDPEAVRDFGATGDIRLAWLLSDMLRFFQESGVRSAAIAAVTDLTGVPVESTGLAAPWIEITDRLIAWDVPAPPGYADYKERLFTLVEPGWKPFFDDEDADVDWRLISWGGVFIDDRRFANSDPCPRGCIPALDAPAVTDAAGGSWYPDDSIVFGVVINGEARAYPKNIMEVHEMVNDTLGGRRIGMPYCTLCGAAQAFFTDDVPGFAEPLVLRTSGLLSRSNKVMYELNTTSMFDTFRGVALTGPLREAGVVLEPIAVVTSTWGDWKQAHPDTTIVAHDGGIGRIYAPDPLQGRDDNGPIFPVGDVDPRLPVQEQVLGVIATDGTPVAFPAAAARETLAAGESVASHDVELELDGGGIRAYTSAGSELASHQSFWFAWSQFYPDTVLWQP
jgi:hypothetical protein